MAISYNKTREAAEKRAYRLVYRTLSRQYKAIQGVAVEQSIPSALNALNRINTKQWSDTLSEIYKTEGGAFYMWQESQWPKEKRFVRADFETGFFSEIWKQIMKTVMSNPNLIIRIKGITDTTISDVRKVLEFGMANNMGSREIARYMSQQIGYVRMRSLRIARTETTFAASLGSEQAALNSTLPLVKVWTASKNELVTRPDHLEANNKRAPKNELFNIGGKLMKYPGDPNGGASQVINCRCNVTYVVDES